MFYPSLIGLLVLIVLSMALAIFNAVKKGKGKDLWKSVSSFSKGIPVGAWGGIVELFKIIKKYPKRTTGVLVVTIVAALLFWFGWYLYSNQGTGATTQPAASRSTAGQTAWLTSEGILRYQTVLLVIMTVLGAGLGLLFGPKKSEWKDKWQEVTRTVLGTAAIMFGLAALAIGTLRQDPDTGNKIFDHIGDLRMMGLLSSILGYSLVQIKDWKKAVPRVFLTAIILFMISFFVPKGTVPWAIEKITRGADYVATSVSYASPTPSTAPVEEWVIIGRDSRDRERPPAPVKLLVMNDKITFSYFSGAPCVCSGTSTSPDNSTFKGTWQSNGIPAKGGEFSIERKGDEWHGEWWDPDGSPKKKTPRQFRIVKKKK